MYTGEIGEEPFLIAVCRKPPLLVNNLRPAKPGHRIWTIYDEDQH
jgi:hypothetical protein